jgi:AraC family transcriptional regulator of adaptative response/methylated-DNA-[protein]-cysteine methyltransferase
MKVWQALLQIPEGTLTSYGTIADHIGASSASRAVGSAIGKNPVGYLIPCHRVITSMGETGGYRWDPIRKQAMIGKEAAHAHQNQATQQTLF